MASDETKGPAAEEPDRARRGRLLRRSRRRTFYSIGEVCSMIGVKPHVLRYWETQFEDLSPSKNRAGNRVYRAEEIEQIALIHQLVHGERYTVEGARKRIGELRAEGTAAGHSSQALQRAYLRSLRAELAEVEELLDPGIR